MPAPAPQPVTGATWAGPTQIDIRQWPRDDAERYSVEGFGRIPLAYSCITCIALSASEARPRVMSGADDDAVELTDSPLARLLVRPNRRQSWFAFSELYHVYLNSTGNAFILKVRGGGGQVIELRLLRSGRMSMIPGPDGPRVWIYTIGGQDYPIDPADIIFIPRPHPFDDFWGLSPMHVLARHLNLQVAMVTLQEAIFRNGGMVTGLLKFQRELDEDTDEPTLIRRQWKQTFAGRNAGDIAILGAGADYQQVALDVDKLAMLDLQHVSEATICGAFRVSPSTVYAMIGLLRNTMANAEQEQIKFWVNCLNPENKRFMDGLTLGLRDDFPGDWRLESDTSNVRALQPDEDALFDRWGKAHSVYGGVTLNEFRLEIGKKEVPGGDFFLIPSLMTRVSLEELKNPPPEPASAPAQIGAPNAANGAAPTPGEVKPEPSVKPEPPARSAGIILEHRARHPKLAHLADTFHRMIDRRAAPLATEIATYQEKLARTAMGVIGRHQGEGRAAPPSDNPNNYPFDPSVLIPLSADAQLAEILRRAALGISEDVWAAVNDGGYAGDIAWDAARPSVAQLLAGATTRAIGVNAVTREQIGDMLAIGTERGYSIRQLAQGVPVDGFAGIKSLITDKTTNADGTPYTGQTRSELIARTELSNAQRDASLKRYAAADLEEVEISDGEDFDETCAERNGTVMSLADAMALDEHPNGTLSFLPVIPADQPEDTGASQ